MKTSSRKIISVFLILAGSVPLLLTVFILFKESSIYRQMRQRLREEGLQTVRVAEKDVVWMDKHEIWVNNSMFDIKTKELKDGVYTFTGLYDEEETELVNLEDDLHRNNPSDDKLLSQLVEQIQDSFAHPDNEAAGLFYKKLSYTRFPEPRLVTLSQEILLPPPRYCAS